MKQDASPSPLRLHWWKAEPNFGDAINPLIVGHMSGRAVEHTGPRNADLFAVGSLLQVVKRGHKEPREGDRVCVWGTGLIRPVFGHEFLENVDVALLRGPITAALVKYHARQFGDPGLLIDEVLPFDGTVADRIGIVPHYTQIDDPWLLAFVASDPAYLLIDPRDDTAEVCHKIAGCAHVLASSLHGLIVADAYGVANTWIEPEGQSWLKYLDYATSVGRTDMKAPKRLDEINGAANGTITYRDGIAAARDALHDSFPDKFKTDARRRQVRPARTATY